MPVVATCTKWYVFWMQFHHELPIDAAPDVVWALTLDVLRWPEITPTIREVEALDAPVPVVGSRYRLRQPGQAARVWVVDVVDPVARRLVWSAPFGPWRLVAAHEVAAADVGSVNHLRLRIEGRAAAMVGRVLGPAFRRALRTENEGFAAAARAMS